MPSPGYTGPYLGFEKPGQATWKPGQCGRETPHPDVATFLISQEQIV